MATVTLTIPDQYLDRVVTALCAGAGVPATPANAKKALLEFVRTTVRNVEQAAAVDAAAAAVTPPDVSGIVS